MSESLPHPRFSLYAALAGAFGLVAVAVGAFAAHAVSDPQARSWLDLGARYQFIHTIAAMVALGFWQWGARSARWAPPLFLGGITLFSGSLYALAFGAPRWVGALTPIGGAIFMLGWAVLAWAGLQLGKTRGKT
jgi:uncharacterized membrane protein YgdD (TMEM256/DUF423 family)